MPVVDGDSREDASANFLPASGVLIARLRLKRLLKQKKEECNESALLLFLSFGQLNEQESQAAWVCASGLVWLAARTMALTSEE